MNTLTKVVLDTNVVLSALIFGKGSTVQIRKKWQLYQFIPLASNATIAELIRVLNYPKFRLTLEDQEELLADYLPFCQTIIVPENIPTPICRDSKDQPFLELAIAGEADYLVTGDLDLLILAENFVCPIISVETFLSKFPNKN